MLKRLGLLAALLLSMSLISSGVIAAETPNYDTMTDYEISRLYRPYEAVLDALNKEYGTSVGIISNDYLILAGTTARDIYIKTISQSLSDFENEIRAYIANMNGLNASAANGVAASPKINPAPRYQITPAAQSVTPSAPQYQTSSGGYLLLNDNVEVAPRIGNYTDTQHLMFFRGGGMFLKATLQYDPVTFAPVYGTILSYGAVDAPDGSNFLLSSSSAVKASDSSYIRVTVSGVHVSSSGYSDITYRTYSYNFPPGVTMLWGSGPFVD